MPLPRIFVSHSHHDNYWCRPFVQGLQADGLDVWYDEKGLGAGADWVATIQHELQTRDVFLLIITPESWASAWVQDEMKLALATRRQIVPVLHKPTQIDGFILTKQHINVTDLVPEAASARVARAIRESVSPSVPAAALPHVVPAPHIMPISLYNLGFLGREINGVEVIVPPTRDVSAGDFRMGSDKQFDPQAFDNELPQHVVHLDAFQIATFPVTIAEYACAVNASAVNMPTDVGIVQWAKQLTQQDHPIIGVSWNDAMTYAAWLSHVTGESWRLPTEAQWEKAARGTDGRLYPWGNRWDRSRANTTQSNLGTTCAVGAHPSGASPYGVQDMAGNVWEWCHSLYRPYPYRANAGGEDEGNTENPRAIHGGSWGSEPRNVRVAFRNSIPANGISNYGGFRLVRLMTGN